jgi:DNA-3-methyladenine glycosylase II
VADFELVPRGPFSLAAARDFAGGFPAGIGGGGVAGAGEASIAMSFPIEGWHSSAAVELRQASDGRLVGQTDAPEADLPAVLHQVSRSLSLDHDASSWPDVGERDPVIGRLQREHEFLRPVCFYSAYEAATSFVIGQRISMRQGARIKERLREEHGDRPTVNGHQYAAFPRPQQLLALKEIPGVAATKVEWLHGLAAAALDGRLDSGALRAMPFDEALAGLRELPGVGPWTAEAILLRGCGVADELPSNDEVTARAVAALYDREVVTTADLNDLAEAWRPYRMWAVVLLRVGWNRSTGPTSYRVARPSAAPLLRANRPARGVAPRPGRRIASLRSSAAAR